jgi:predicted dehydrogenase
MTINAGFIPLDHWTQDKSIGGGRIIGEACHFIDLATFLANSQIIEYQRSSMLSKTNDTATLQLKFANGTIASIHYFSNGSKSIPKERIEVFYEGKNMILNNYRYLKGYNTSGFTKMKKLKQDKGQLNCVGTFINAIKNNYPPPSPYKELFDVSKLTIDLQD